MTSIPRPHSPYFLVRVSKQKEKEARAPKHGSIVIPETLTFMQYNTQCGEIVGIGDGAAKYFPEAQIGHILLMHHFCQANDENEARVNHLIHDDEEFNYYVVSAYSYNGKDCETYGVWDGEKIIPNKDYVILEKEIKDVSNLNWDRLTDEQVNKSLSVSNAGILMFKEWEESREQKEARQAELKKQTEELSKSGNNKLKTKQAILLKEWEMEAISRDINKQTYLPYKILYANKELSEWFDRPVGEGSIVGMLNFSTGTTINFNGTEIVVAKTKFIAYLYDNAIAV